MVAISAQSNSSQETVKSIQEGTVKLVSEAEIAKQNIVLIEKRIDILAEQKRKESIPPIHSDPEIQTLDQVNLEANTDLSPVLKREPKAESKSEEAQSANINETHDQSNSVSKNPVSSLQLKNKRSPSRKLKSLRQRRRKLRRRNKLLTMEEIDFESLKRNSRLRKTF